MQIVMDKKAVKASFSKAAIHYDLFAELQREVGHQLLALSIPNINSMNKVLDLGCGTGYFSEILNKMQFATNSSFLNKSNQQTQLTCFDLSHQMLQQAANRQLLNCQYVEGDIDQLPFAKPLFDFVFSSLVLQWSQRLSLSLQQIKETLQTDATFAFSTLLDGSLIELKEAWRVVDNEKHINQFLTLDELKTSLKTTGFKQVKIKIQTHTQQYKDVVSVMKALKGIGANHVHESNKSRITGRSLLKKLEAGYAPYRDEMGLYPLSYQVCYVIIKQ